jgi:hypothetical protein
MIEFRWDTTAVVDFGALVHAIPADVLNSPRRSVIPLIDFFRQPSTALVALGSALQLELVGATELAFEYAVPPPKGQGKPSYTDLMIRCADVSIAIEAKYTEPRYESVRSWLGTSPTPNRLAVLTGWLSLINKTAQEPVGVESVLDLPYQLVHRTASACSTAATDRVLAYMVFGDDPGAYYADDVAALDRLLGEPAGLAIHVLSIPLCGEPALDVLIERWDAGERQLSGAVREVLLMGPLFRFGPIRALYDRPGRRALV